MSIIRSVDFGGWYWRVAGLAEEDIMRLIGDRGNSCLVTYAWQWLLVMGGGDGSGAVVIYVDRSPSQLETCTQTVPAITSHAFAV